MIFSFIIIYYLFLYTPLVFIQGRRNRSSWSGFGRTRFGDLKIKVENIIRVWNCSSEVEKSQFACGYKKEVAGHGSSC